MTEFFNIIFSLPTAVFTWPLMLVVLYWGVAAFGLFNLHWFDGAGAALEGSAGALDGAVEGAIDGVVDSVDGAGSGVVEALSAKIEG